MSRLSQPSRRPIRVAILAGIALFAIVVAVVLVRTSNPASATNPTSVAHFVAVGADHHAMNDATRTLVITSADETLPQLSGTNGVLIASLVSGNLPAHLTQATVQTDTNCTPDQQGVSHCLNQLTIGTAQVMVQHHHAMSTTPCLTPGETVNLLTLAQYQRENS